MESMNITAGMPPWAKGAILVGGVVLAVYLVKKVVTIPQQIKDGAGSRDESKESYQEMDKLVSSGAKATISDSQASAIANQLVTAMDGYGTDEDSILLAMAKIQNDLDFLKVKNKYGIREISSGRFNPEPNYNGNLGGALHSELSVYWTNLINEVMKRKGITYSI